MVVGLAGNLGERRSRGSRSCSATSRGADRNPAAVALAATAACRVHEKVSDQAHLCLGVAGYPIQHPDRYVLELLRTVLGGGMSSRLFTEVRERRGLAYYVFAANQGYTDRARCSHRPASTSSASTRR